MNAIRFWLICASAGWRVGKQLQNVGFVGVAWWVMQMVAAEVLRRMKERRLPWES